MDSVVGALPGQAEQDPASVTLKTLRSRQSSGAMRSRISFSYFCWHRRGTPRALKRAAARSLHRNNSSLVPVTPLRRLLGELPAPDPKADLVTTDAGRATGRNGSARSRAAISD